MQNSALVEESAAAAFALQEHAEQQKAAVGWFRVEIDRRAVSTTYKTACSLLGSRLVMAGP